MIDLLMNLFRAVWNAERMPDRLNESRIILLHKGGHKSMKELKNYRPIALMDTIGKVFCMLLNERMKRVLKRWVCCVKSRMVLGQTEEVRITCI